MTIDYFIHGDTIMPNIPLSISEPDILALMYLDATDVPNPFGGSDE